MSVATQVDKTTPEYEFINGPRRVIVAVHDSCAVMQQQGGTPPVVPIVTQQQGNLKVLPSPGETSVTSAAGDSTGELIVRLEQTAGRLLQSLLSAHTVAAPGSVESALWSLNQSLDKWPIESRNLLRSLVKLTDMGHPLSISLELVDRDQMQSLNGQFRDKFYPTNVLSFPALDTLENNEDDESSVSANSLAIADSILDIEAERSGSGRQESSLPDIPLGDIVLCTPVIADEALQQGKHLEAHWSHMLVHGVLHLLGFDHRGDQQASVMEALEIDLLAQMGFANPYETAQ